MNETEPKRPSETEPNHPFALPTGELANAWSSSMQRFASAMAAVNADMMKFASRRFEAQAKAWEACAHCSDVTTLTRTQGKFLSEMAADYANETTELMHLTQDMLANGGNHRAK